MAGKKKSSTKPNALVLLSGGMDSATTLAVAKDRGLRPMTLSILYGQRHAWEVECAAKIAAVYDVHHIVTSIDQRLFGNSALTFHRRVPKNRSAAERTSTIPVTYVPARNMIFLALAVACAESHDIGDVFIGANQIDYSGYPDCRAEFLTSFQKTANLATRYGIEAKDGDGLCIHAPLLDMTKEDIVRLGMQLRVPYQNTTSCYDPDAYNLACGSCDACMIRRQAFAAVGQSDPIIYR